MLIPMWTMQSIRVTNDEIECKEARNWFNDGMMTFCEIENSKQIIILNCVLVSFSLYILASFWQSSLKDSLKQKLKVNYWFSCLLNTRLSRVKLIYKRTGCFIKAIEFERDDYGDVFLSLKNKRIEKIGKCVCVFGDVFIDWGDGELIRHTHTHIEESARANRWF